MSPSLSSPQLINLTTRYELEEETNLVCRLTLGFGIVLNQSCDLTGRSKTPKPLLVSRILPASNWKINDDDPRGATSKIKELAQPGRHPTTFYLPAYSNEYRDFKLAKSCANLLDVVRFPPNDIPAITTACLKLRLTKDALGAFQERVSHCFGRFAAPDDLYFSKEELQSMQL